MFYGKREVKVLERGQALSKVEEPDGESYWVPTEKLTEAPQAKNNYKFAQVVPAKLSSVFLELLAQHLDEVLIRVHYPKHAEAHTHEIFQKAGVILPPDIRPLMSGKHGGVTVQRDWAAVVWFPKFDCPMPEGTQADLTRKNFLMNSRRDVVLAILQAGFPITEYTKQETHEETVHTDS